MATAELAAAAQYLTLADQHQAAATSEVKIGKFADAEAALTAALECANAGKVIVEKAKALQDLKPPAGVDASALQARIDKFPALKSHVKSQTGDTTFDALLNSADAPVQEAVTALLGEAPQLDVAGAALDTADGILADALQKIARKPAYDTQLAAAELEANTTLPGLNVDPNKCLVAEIKAIEALITAAKDLAKSPDFGFGAACQKLAEAQIKAAQAHEKHTVFLSLVADRQIIKDLISHLEGGFVPALAAERDRLNKVQTDIDKQLAALNFAAARKLTADGKALKAPFEKLCTDYTAIVLRRTTVYADADTEIVGKTMCKVEEDELKLQKVQVDKLIDTDHAFAAAGMLLTRIGHLAFFAVEEVRYHKEFADARKPLADRLPAIKLAGNDGVKTPIAGVEAAFKRADDFAARREYEQAKIELKPLKDALDGIDRDTPLYAAFELSYKTAETRFLAAAQHVKLEVVLPLLAVIDTQYKQCKVLADRREFVAAKALADEIPGNCDAAILAADGYSQFEALGAGDQPPEATALEEAAKKIEQKVQDVRKDTPDAEQQPSARW